MLTTNRTDKLRAELKRDHEKTPYYDDVEAANMLALFWGEQSVFKPLFDKLDLKSVVELACGHGRHTEQFLARAGHVTLVDIVGENIDFCRKRFKESKNVSYVVNNGRDLSAIKTASQTAVFSYDAMVHFEFLDVQAYIGDIARVLKPGGRALLHYTVNDEDPTASYRDNKRWRNFGSEKVFIHTAHRAGLNVIDHFTTSWPPNNGEAKIDGVTLLERAS